MSKRPSDSREALAHIVVIICGGFAVLQAPMFDGLAAPEVDVSGGELAQVGVNTPIGLDKLRYPQLVVKGLMPKSVRRVLKSVIRRS